MRLCIVTETGLEFVDGVIIKAPVVYDSMSKLETAMRKLPNLFENGVQYTLHEDKPILVLRSETTVRLEKK